MWNSWCSTCVIWTRTSETNESQVDQWTIVCLSHSHSFWFIAAIYSIYKCRPNRIFSYQRYCKWTGAFWNVHLPESLNAADSFFFHLNWSELWLFGTHQPSSLQTLTRKYFNTHAKISVCVAHHSVNWVHQRGQRQMARKSDKPENYRKRTCLLQ